MDGHRQQRTGYNWLYVIPYRVAWSERGNDMMENSNTVVAFLHSKVSPISLLGTFEIFDISLLHPFLFLWCPESWYSFPLNVCQGFRGM